MADDKDNPLSAEPTWVVPVGALSFNGVVWLFMAGIHGFIFSGLGWRWLGAVRPLASFIVMGCFVAYIRFFKITDEIVTVYSWAGLRRKHIQLDSIDSIYGRWGADEGRWGRRCETSDQYIPGVYVRCHDGHVIKLNEGRPKLCRRLITEIRRRLPANGSHESSPRCVLSDLADPLQARLVEWVLDYVIGLIVLGLHVFILFKFLQYKGIL